MATTAGVMHELDAGGDSKIRWNSDNATEVEAARAHFDSLRKKGFQGFRMDRNDTKGEQMTAFEPEAERILMVPPRVGG